MEVSDFDIFLSTYGYLTSPVRRDFQTSLTIQSLFTRIRKGMVLNVSFSHQFAILLRLVSHSYCLQTNKQTKNWESVSKAKVSPLSSLSFGYKQTSNLKCGNDSWYEGVFGSPVGEYISPVPVE